ncbi:MAG: outer membrane beta-barrel protein [Pseudomonadota bacterium]
MKSMLNRKLLVVLMLSASGASAQSYMDSSVFEVDVNNITSYEYFNFRVGNLISESIAVEARGNIGQSEGGFYVNESDQTSYEFGFVTKLFTKPIQNRAFGHYFAIGYSKSNVQENIRAWWYQDQMTDHDSTLSYATGWDYQINSRFKFNTEYIHSSQEDIDGINISMSFNFD